MPFHQRTPPELSKAYNQFIQHQMRNEQPDKEKLIKIASLLRQEFHLTVQREAILTFSKEDGHLVDYSNWITEEQFHKYVVHVPDLLFFINGKLWILEIDGFIHFVKSSVHRKDELRDECYDRANLNWKKFDEVEILTNLGVKKLRGAKVSEIWPEVKKFIQTLV